MLSSDVTIVYLATLMYNEPNTDGLTGKTAAGLIVRNRVLAGWEGQDWISLIKNHDRYSANPPETPRVLVLGDPARDDQFRRLLGIAANIYAGLEKDITYGALRYCRLSECSEEFANKIVRPTKLNPENGCTELLHPRVAQVGQITFFK